MLLSFQVVQDDQFSFIFYLSVSPPFLVLCTVKLTHDLIFNFIICGIPQSDYISNQQKRTFNKYYYFVNTIDGAISR